MIGTEKQIAWATDIQAKVRAPYEAKLAQIAAITGLEDAGQEMRDNAVKAAAEAQEAIDLINSVTDAKWWIDNRAFATLLKIKRTFARA